MKHVEFEVAGIYANCIGSYKVLSKGDKTMYVEYLDGPKHGLRQDLEMAGQVKVIRNRHLREFREMKMREIDMGGSDESFTLGYLAQNAFACVRIKESSRQWFEATYRKLTGVDAPEPNTEGNYYNISSDDVQGSWDYYHVGFPTPPDHIKGVLSFGHETETHWDVFGTISKHNGMNYLLHLFKLGFRLGKHHEVDAIRENIEDKDAFDNGFFFVDQVRAAA